MSDLVTQYSGVTPSRSLSQVAFNAAIETWLAWLKNLPGEMNTAIATIIGLRDAKIYNAATTYNPTGYSVPDAVYGSDGMTYGCIGTNVLADDPIGSATGNWVKLTFSNSLPEMPAGIEVTGNITGFDYQHNTADPDHDIDLLPGSCKDSTNTTDIKSGATITKRIDASFTHGTGNGGMMDGTVAANKAYQIIMLLRDSDGAVCWGFLIAGASIPAAILAVYSKWRRRGFVRTDASANICSFSMTGYLMEMGKASANVIASVPVLAIASAAVIDHSTFMPENLVSAIAYGVRGGAASVTQMMSTLDGVNNERFFGTSYNTDTDISVNAWGVASQPHDRALIPYSPLRKFYTGGTAGSLLGKSFLLKV